MSVLLPAVALDHVGLASADPPPLARALGLDARRGVPMSSGVPMPSGVVVTRFGPERSLEWVAPHRPPTPVDGFLCRFGPGLHHVALRVQRPLDELLRSLRDAGCDTSPVEPSSDGRPSLFVHPRSMGGVLVELVEGDPR